MCKTRGARPLSASNAGVKLPTLRPACYGQDSNEIALSGYLRAAPRGTFELHKRHEGTPFGRRQIKDLHSSGYAPPQ